MNFDLDSSTPTSSLGHLEAPLTVSDLTELIKLRLETEFLDVVIAGEVSNFKPHPSGHFYFSLKDEAACISAVMFRGQNSRLKFQLENGHKVVAFGKISVYPPRGFYQIVISRIEPAGQGALQLAFEQLKKKLDALGYFRLERKRALPKFPKRIGLVTASSGAAIRDMLNVLNRRFAGLHIRILPVKVQGDGAAEEISKAIKDFNAFFPDTEVLIVGRGGGSIEDLWAFNEEIVATAIFESTIPVISAVGHEVDFTIADFVADLRAPTPSAAAELVIGNKYETLLHLDHLQKRLSRVLSKVELYQMRYDDLLQRLERSLAGRVAELRFQLENLRLRLSERSPRVLLTQARQDYELLNQRLIRHLPQRIKELRWQLSHMGSKLNLLNPRAIMERGYSIVRNERTQRLITKASDVRMGDTLLIEFAKGRVRARV